MESGRFFFFFVAHMVILSFCGTAQVPDEL